MLKLAIFGATGSTGRHVVPAALEAGHRVTVLTRDPSRLNHRDDVAVVVGDVRDPAAVSQAVEGQDAVLVLLGAPPSDRSGVRAEGTRVIVQAMQEHGVRRLVAQSSLGVGESLAGMDFFTRHIVLGLWLRHVVADHEAQEAVLRESGLDWTVVRPPHLTNKPGTGSWRAGWTMTQAPPQMSISREDLAAFLVESVTSDEALGEAIGVSG